MRPFVATSIAALLAGVLVSCGVPDPGASVAPWQCSPVPQVTALTVQRHDAFPQNHLRFAFPASVTTADREHAQSTADLLCSLPLEPARTGSCPLDLGVTYLFDFTTAPDSRQVVALDAAGCEQVTGLGATRWFLTTPNFYAQLAAALGVSYTGDQMFTGVMPGT